MFRTMEPKDPGSSLLWEPDFLFFFVFFLFLLSFISGLSLISFLKEVHLYFCCEKLKN